MSRRIVLSKRLTVALAVAGVAAVVAAAAVGHGSLTTASTASATPMCATSKLVVWLDTRGSAAAGTSYYRLQFTNLSGHA